MDNIFIKHPRRSLKYEQVCLRARENTPEARKGIHRWMNFYNQGENTTPLKNEPPIRPTIKV